MVPFELDIRPHNPSWMGIGTDLNLDKQIVREDVMVLSAVMVLAISRGWSG